MNAIHSETLCQYESRPSKDIYADLCARIEGARFPLCKECDEIAKIYLKKWRRHVGTVTFKAVEAWDGTIADLAVHELFHAYCDEGETEDDACWLVWQDLQRSGAFVEVVCEEQTTSEIWVGVCKDGSMVEFDNCVEFDHNQIRLFDFIRVAYRTRKEIAERI